jgi:outer membrane protein assembly factor BamB
MLQGRFSTRLAPLSPWQIRQGIVPLTLLAACCLLLEPASAQNNPLGAGRDDVADSNSIIRPATRELRQLLNRARKALDEKEYPAAVQALEELLTDKSLDDYFLAAPNQPDGQVSVKSLANQLLGTLPPTARQLYETQVGHEARQKLNVALQDRDLAGVSEVARRYVHTKAGYEAAFLLARIELDQGRALAAALRLQGLAEQTGARELLDPELTVLAATAWKYARRDEKAKELLAALKQRSPRVKVRVADGELPLFDNEAEALKWLDGIAGRTLTPAASIANQWVTFRGDEARNAATTGGLPLVSSEWYLNTINDPKLLERITLHTRTLQDRGESLIPAMQSLAVKTTRRDGQRVDYVVVRTPEEIQGVSLKNGRRIWVYPWQKTSAGSSGSISQGVQQQANARENTLRQRVWDDNLYSQMTSDGERLFFVDDLEYTNPTNSNLAMRGVWIGARPLSRTSKAANQLQALDLARQGYRVWQIGGESGGDDPQLAGAFFLGAPLALADRLYVMAEVQGEIRLLCLLPETGELEWKQQLGSIPEENMSIQYDSPRRLAGAAPSFADGLMICPTSAGAVVAVDLGTRSLKWNYTYDRSDLPQRPVRGVITSSNGNPAPSPGHWLDSAAIISEGMVVVTPVESQFLHCLDLVTGKPRWLPIKREDYLFVACIHEGKAILVGKSRVKAIQLSDGKEAWSTPTDLQSEYVTGRGFYSGDSYIVPTTGQQLVKIDLNTGKVTDRARMEFTLGNLFCFDGQIVSVGSTQFSAFYMAEHLRAQVTRDLEANPNDVRALTRMGELLLTDNKVDEALTTLRKAHALQPDETRVRALIARVMLLLLRADFVKHRALVDEARELIDDPAQRRELLRLQAVGLHQAGLVTESLEAFVMLADELQDVSLTDEDEAAQMEYIDGKLQVRTGRWLHARLSELYQHASEGDRQRLQQRLSERLERCLRSGSLAAARRFVDVYGFHPAADRVRLVLVERLLKERSLLEAELRAGDLLLSADPGYQAAGLAGLASAYREAQRDNLFANRRQELAKLLSEHPLASEHPAAALVASLGDQQPLPKSLRLDHWPGGKLTKIDGNIDPNRARPYMNNFNISLTEMTGPAAEGVRALYDPSQQALQVIDSLGKTIAQAPIRRSDGIYRRSYSIPYSGLVGRTVGHIVVVHTGGEVIAIDALRPNRATAEPILWRGEIVSVDPTMGNTAYPQLRQVANPVIGNRMMAFDSSGQTNYQPGPVTPNGVVYQRSRQLTCVDPVTGATLWERNGVPAACELFGDEELVFAVPPNTNEALVFSMVDGAQLGTRTVPKPTSRLVTSGRRVLAWEQVGNSLRLRLTDAWSEGEDLWKLETTTGAKGQIIEGDEFALLETTGKLTVISLHSGQVKITANLIPEEHVNSVHVLRSQEQYTVLVNQPVAESVPGLMTTPLSGGGQPGQQAHGRVYALDRQTGKPRWQTPAFIGQHGLPWDQPVDSPLMVFIRNRRAANNGNWTAELLCLDKRDGSIAFEGDIASAQANMCEVQADFDKQAVQVTTWVQPGTMRVTLIKLSDDPVPPRAPAQTGHLSSVTAGQPAGEVVKLNPQDGKGSTEIDGNIQLIGPNGVPIRLPPNVPPQMLERLKQLQQQRQLPPQVPVVPRR